MLEHELVHLLLSLGAGAIVFSFYRRWQVLAIALISGFFVDSDHLFDYFLYKRAFDFDLTEFFKGEFFDLAGKVYVPFHAFEYAFIAIGLGLVFLKTRKSITEKKKLAAFLMLAFGISLIFHLVFDTLTYKPKLPTYFILYRIYQQFDHDKLGFE